MPPVRWRTERRPWTRSARLPSVDLLDRPPFHLPDRAGASYRASGARGASRPREGPSPPGRLRHPVRTNLLQPDAADIGARSRGGPSCPIHPTPIAPNPLDPHPRFTSRSVRTSISYDVRRRSSCVAFGETNRTPSSDFGVITPGIFHTKEPISPTHSSRSPAPMASRAGRAS